MKQHYWPLIAVLVIVALITAACGPSAAEDVPATQPVGPAGGLASPVATTGAAGGLASPAATTGAGVATAAATSAGAMATGTPATDAMGTGTPATGAMGTGTPAAGLRTAQEAALAAAGGQQIGGTVSLLGPWGGAEQEAFLAMLQPFQEATGIDVQYTGTRDAAAILVTQVQGGNPPDLADFANPGQMAEFANQGRLVDLSTVLDMNTYGQQYAKTWVDLGTVDGKLYGMFMKAAVKGLIWYNPSVWQAQNFQQPTTWDEMMSLAEQMAAAGNTQPFCVAVESQAASGWPGTDWLEDIVLRQAGPDVYRQWYQGEIKWTSPEIRQAWETWGRVVGDPKMIFGGANRMLTANFGNVGDPLFTNPPGCYMAHQASFIADFFVQNNPNARPVQDFTFFPFPAFEAGASDQMVTAGDLIAMFNDTPQARALISYLASPEAQAIWAQRGGGYLSPNQAVPTTAYPDELSQMVAGRLTSVEEAVFDASDQMPQAMNDAFWKAVLEFIQAPDNLDDILANLDTIQADAYNR